MPSLCVDDREARADGQGGKLIDRVPASTPVRELLLIEALGHTRVPFLGYRPDHRGGIELATIRTRTASGWKSILCPALVFWRRGWISTPVRGTAFRWQLAEFEGSLFPIARVETAQSRLGVDLGHCC
jgi:hypothetical protein